MAAAGVVLVVARDLKEVNSTGNVTTSVPAYLWSVTLTAGSDAATLVIKDGSSGPTRVTLKAAANSTVQWRAASPDGVLMGTAIHATFTGTGPVADIEFD